MVANSIRLLAVVIIIFIVFPFLYWAQFDFTAFIPTTAGQGAKSGRHRLGEQLCLGHPAAVESVAFGEHPLTQHVVCSLV